MLNRECGAESQGMLPHLFIPSKTATQVPDIAMEDLSLGRIAALAPEFVVKDLPVGRTLMMMIWRWTNVASMNDRQLAIESQTIPDLEHHFQIYLSVIELKHSLNGPNNNNKLLCASSYQWNLQCAIEERFVQKVEY